MKWNVTSFTLWRVIKDNLKKCVKPIENRVIVRLKGVRGRGTLATEKLPVFGMIQRSGEVRIWMLENVQQVTIKPIILSSIAAGTLILPRVQHVQSARTMGFQA